MNEWSCQEFPERRKIRSGGLPSALFCFDFLSLLNEQTSVGVAIETEVPAGRRSRIQGASNPSSSRLVMSGRGP